MRFPDLDELLIELRRRRWVLYVFGPCQGPDVVAAVFQWSMCADVVILRGEQDASAYRVPTFPDTDVFAPELVSWQYHAPAAWTLRAVLTLDPPGHPRAPIAVLRPAGGCFMPPKLRRPVTIRPTSLAGLVAPDGPEEDSCRGGHGRNPRCGRSDEGS